MDSSEIYDYAIKKGWLLIHEGDYTHVYEKSLPVFEGVLENYANRKYIYVMQHSNGEYDSDGSKLVIPHTGDIFELEDDEDARTLCWWFEGNYGSQDDWWNQMPEEEKQ